MGAIRYSFGGDEHVFAEIDEEMSLEASSRAWRSAPSCRPAAFRCDGNLSRPTRPIWCGSIPTSFIPDKMLGKLKEIEAELGSADLELPTRIIEIPVLYNDPWTHETLMRFRERHQDPTAPISNMVRVSTATNRVDDFIAAHASAPWFVSMVGFVAGLPFLFQMVEREKQLEVPKYLRPRTDTPSSRSAMAAASPRSTRCVALAAISSSASRRRRSTIQRRSCLT